MTTKNEKQKHEKLKTKNWNQKTKNEKRKTKGDIKTLRYVGGNIVSEWVNE